MFGLNTSVYTNVLQFSCKFFIAHVVEHGTGDCLAVPCQDAQFFGNCDSSVNMVTGDHDRTDTGAVTLSDSVFHFGTNGVDHAA